MKTAEYLTPAQYALEHRWGYIDAQPPRIRAKDVAWERRELREHTEMVTKTAYGKDRHISMLTASGEFVSTEKFRKDMYQTNTCAKMLNVMKDWGVTQLLVWRECADEAVCCSEKDEAVCCSE